MPRIGSEAMKAAGMDSLSDSAATGAVLFSMAVGYFTELKIDGWVRLPVACFVLYAGYEAAKDTLNPLLGQPPSKEYVERIREIVMSHPEILGSTILWSMIRAWPADGISSWGDFRKRGYLRAP